MQSHETSHSSKSSEHSASVPVLNLFPARQFGVSTQTESIAENTGLDEANGYSSHSSLNLGHIAVSAPGAPPLEPPPQPSPLILQRRLNIGQSGDKYEVENGYSSHSSLNLGHIAVSAPGAPPLEPPPQPSPLILQRRLNIGQSGDKYEVEADKGASQVVNLISSPLFRNIQSQKISSPKELEPESQRSIQRQSTGLNPFNISVYEPGTTPPPPIQTVQAKGDNIKAAPGNIEDTIKSKKGSGEELADNVKEPMETAFDANFSRVKVHTDGESDQLNKSLNSRAFATGQDIFFSQGAYNPGSRDGQELLAHELTHIVQQNGGVQRKIVQHQTTEQKIVQMMPKVKSGNLSVKDAQIALAKANKELAFELAQTAADIAGIVDPTPISDGISAAMSLAKGDYVGAGLSIVSMIPYLGDTIGKPIKAARNGKKILKLRKEIAELIQIIEKFSPAGRKASAKTKDAVAQEIKQVLKPTLGNTKNKITLSANRAKHLVDNLIENPKSIWGKSAEDIAQQFKDAGYEVILEKSTKGSKLSTQIRIQGHPKIANIQVHPGGGRHGGSYYKISTSTQGTIKIVDPITYKPTPGEKATIINITN
jgi:hypothetical protein